MEEQVEIPNIYSGKCGDTDGEYNREWKDQSEVGEWQGKSTIQSEDVTRTEQESRKCEPAVEKSRYCDICARYRKPTQWMRRENPKAGRRSVKGTQLKRMAP